MGQIPDRPDGYPLHAALWTSADNLTPVVESLFRSVGNEKNTLILSDDINGKFQSIGFWIGHTDCKTIKNQDWLSPTVNAQLSVDKLRYVVGDPVKVLPGADVDTRTVVLIQGRRVETDITLLRVPVAEPLYSPGVPLPGRVWVYVNKDAVIRLENVGPAVADTPDVGNDEITLVGVDVDAAGLVSGHTDPITELLPSYALPLVIPVAFDTASFEDVTIKQLTAGNGTGVPITVSNVPAGVVGMVITGAGDTFAMTCDGGADAAAAYVNTSTEATFLAVQLGTGRAALLQSNDATSCTLKVEQSGDGCAIEADKSGAGATVTATNAGVGTAVLARNTGSGTSLEANNNDATSAAIQAFNAGGGFAILAIGDMRSVGTVHATTGYQGSGSAAAAFPEGATVAASKSIIGGAGTTYQAEDITADETATAKRVAFTSEQASTGDRQMHHLDGEPRWRDTGDDYIHRGPEPWGPIGSTPALDSFGPLTTPTQGPKISVTLKTNAVMMITAGCDIEGTDASTVARIRILVNAVEVFNTVYSVPLGDTAVVWSKTFMHTGTAGTFDVEMEFDRSAGAGAVNVDNADIVVVPT